MYKSARWNQGLLLGNENATFFSLNKNQRWPLWQFTVLWLLPWFFCSCLFVLMFYLRNKRSYEWRVITLKKGSEKKMKEKTGGEWAVLGERTPPDCGKFGKKQPISPVTLMAPHFMVLAMLWGMCCGRISAVEVACPKHSCVYSSPVTTRWSRKYTC